MITNKFKSLQEESRSKLPPGREQVLSTKGNKATEEGRKNDDKLRVESTVSKQELLEMQGKKAEPKIPEPPKSLKEYLRRFQSSAGIGVRDPIDIIFLIAADERVDQRERATLKTIVRNAGRGESSSSIHAQFLSYFSKKVEESFAQSRGSVLGIRTFERRSVACPDLLTTIQAFAQTIGPHQELSQRAQIQSRILALKEQLDAGPLPVESILIGALCYEEELGVQAALTLMLQAAERAEDINAIAWFVEHKSSLLNGKALEEALSMALPQLEKRSFFCLRALYGAFFVANRLPEELLGNASLPKQLLTQLIRAADPHDKIQTDEVLSTLRKSFRPQTLETGNHRTKKSGRRGPRSAQGIRTTQDKDEILPRIARANDLPELFQHIETRSRGGGRRLRLRARARTRAGHRAL